MAETGNRTSLLERLSIGGIEEREADARIVELEAQIRDAGDHAEQLQIERSELEARLKEAEEKLALDNPELDATEGAHPAWWRGHDHTSKVFKSKLTAAEARTEKAEKKLKYHEGEFLRLLDERAAAIKRAEKAETARDNCAKTAIELLGASFCDTHGEKVKQLGFPAFYEWMKGMGCHACASEKLAAQPTAAPGESGEEYCCGYNTVSGAFHKPGCAGECGFMNPGDAVEQRRTRRRKAKKRNTDA